MFMTPDKSVVLKDAFDIAMIDTPDFEARQVFGGEQPMDANAYPLLVAHVYAIPGSPIPRLHRLESSDFASEDGAAIAQDALKEAKSLLPKATSTLLQWTGGLVRRSTDEFVMNESEVVKPFSTIGVFAVYVSDGDISVTMSAHISSRFIDTMINDISPVDVSERSLRAAYNSQKHEVMTDYEHWKKVALAALNVDDHTPDQIRRKSAIRAATLALLPSVLLPSALDELFTQ